MTQFVLGNYYTLASLDNTIRIKSRLLFELSNFYSFTDETYLDIDDDKIFEQFKNTGSGYVVYKGDKNKFFLRIPRSEPVCDTEHSGTKIPMYKIDDLEILIKEN